MRIGLIADTHNHHHHVTLALSRFSHAGAGVVLHAGDITNVETLRLFAGFDTWVARGNMDHDPALPRAAQTLFGPGHLQLAHTLELDGKRIALLHGDLTGELQKLLDSELYDYIIVGHEHMRKDYHVGKTRIINPGALGGRSWTESTCAILDTTTDDVAWIIL